MKALPAMSARHVAKAAELYTQAVPETPSVSVAGVRAALSMFPANKVPPNLDQIDLSSYVAPRFVERALGKK
jgi:hypothetical protein